MTFGNLTKETLATEIGLTYEDQPYTVQDELRQLEENVLATNFLQLPAVSGKEGLEGLVIYTKTFIGVLQMTRFGDLQLLKLVRNPAGLNETKV